MSGTLNYAHGMLVENLNYVGELHLKNWNSHNAHELIEDVVLSTGTQVISSKKNILGSWNVYGNLNVSGEFIKA